MRGSYVPSLRQKCFDEEAKSPVQKMLTRASVKAADAQWAVDLRMSWPLAKEVLIQRAPIQGFASFEDERQIGVGLALKYQRPALPDVLSKTLPDEIRAHAVERVMPLGG